VKYDVTKCFTHKGRWAKDENREYPEAEASVSISEI
jgi:hypothetical protein